jgi:osmotically-inducible protein OsmY
MCRQSAKSSQEYQGCSRDKKHQKITATVQEGFVTLEGMVEWNYQKTSAVDCAERVHGVLGVINLISVKPPVTATSVKNDIEAALRRD